MKHLCTYFLAENVEIPSTIAQMKRKKQHPFTLITLALPVPQYYSLTPQMRTRFLSMYYCNLHFSKRH